MNRQDLIKSAAEASGQSQAVVGKVLDGILESIQTALCAGEKVSLVGFGNFEAVERAAREGRNPQTGGKITIAASRTPKFTPGKLLKEAVNQ